MSKHTPGPWELVAGRTFHTEDGTFSLSYGRESGTNVPRFRSPERLDANARLIAAAPDLLAAAEWVIGNLPVTAPTANGTLLSTWETMQRKLRLAIARAKGGKE